ncbi:phosphatase PAP2 family protein [Candidatus Bathyarchaeota archaeon]|nr:phosphatase PAP2 family protein [Candidatus Bathyarchaeota archaeon]
METRTSEFKENKRLRYISFIAFFAILGGLTLVFIFTDLDLVLMGLGYDAGATGDDRFFLKDAQPWAFFYEQEGAILGVYIALAAVFIIYGLYRKDKWVFIKYGVFMILAALLGPLIIVNLLFKGYWGRPRPRETVNFGGSAPFFHVWYPTFLEGYTDDNSSFPAGHPSEFIMYFAIFLVFNHPEFLWKYFGKNRDRTIKVLTVIKYSSLMASLVGGTLMAIGRAVQFGHWYSDSLWTFGFIYLTCMLLYYLVFQFPKWEKKIVDGRVGKSSNVRRLGVRLSIIGGFISMTLGLVIPLAYPNVYPEVADMLNNLHGDFDEGTMAIILVTTLQGLLVASGALSFIGGILVKRRNKHGLLLAEIGAMILFLNPVTVLGVEKIKMHKTATTSEHSKNSHVTERGGGE